MRFREYKNGVAEGDEQSILPTGMRYTRDGAAARSGDGVAMVWSGTSDKVHWQIYGARLGEEPQSDEPLSVSRGVAQYPTAAGLPNGNILVAWRLDSSSKPAGLYSRVFDSDFRPVTSETLIWADPRPAERRDHRCWIAASPSNDQAILVWHLGNDRANMRDRDLIGQLLDAEGRGDGHPFYLSQAFRTVDERGPSVAYLGSSTFAAVWYANANPESSLTATVVGRVFDVSTEAPECGDADANGKVATVDALRALSAAVGTTSCDPCLCDVNGSQTTTAVDALAILLTAVGRIMQIGCPPCLLS